MARNRKRAKDRRARRPAADPGSVRGVATARGARGQAPDRGEPERGQSANAVEAESGHIEPPTPDALEHATPDVELAEAPLAVGRPEPVRDGLADDLDDDGAAGGELGGEDYDADAGLHREAPGDVGYDSGGDGESDEPPRGRGELARRDGGAPAPRSHPGGRLVNFLQGSWRELQRVQWPDRRQVMQATGVVIGFVIVAGIFLGVADALAGKVVTYILK